MPAAIEIAPAYHAHIYFQNSGILIKYCVSEITFALVMAITPPAVLLVGCMPFILTAPFRSGNLRP